MRHSSWEGTARGAVAYALIAMLPLSLGGCLAPRATGVGKKFLDRWYAYVKSGDPEVAGRARNRLVQRLRRDDDFFDFVSGEFLLEEASSTRKYELFGLLWEARGGEGCRDHVIYMIQHEDTGLRATGVLRCCFGEVPRISAHLIKAFRESTSDTVEEAQVRYLALDALTNIEGRGARRYILEGLEDPSPRVRSHALLDVAQLRLTNALPRVLEILETLDPHDDEDRLLITPAALALRRLTGKTPPERIRTLQSKRNWWLRELAAHAGRKEG